MKVRTITPTLPQQESDGALTPHAIKVDQARFYSSKHFKSFLGVTSPVSTVQYRIFNDVKCSATLQNH